MEGLKIAELVHHNFPTGTPLMLGLENRFAADVYAEMA